MKNVTNLKDQQKEAVVPVANNVQTISATARQIETAKITINGVLVESTGLSILAKFKLIDVIGTAEKLPHQKGKAASIYSLHSREGFVIGFSPVDNTPNGGERTQKQNQRIVPEDKQDNLKHTGTTAKPEVKTKGDYLSKEKFNSLTDVSDIITDTKGLDSKKPVEVISATSINQGVTSLMSSYGVMST